MAEPEDFSGELDRIEREISALQDYLYEAELYPPQTQPWPRLRRSISLFLTRRYVFRQLQQLHLRRRIIRNCYLYVNKKEPEASPTPGNTGPVGTRHP